MNLHSTWLSMGGHGIYVYSAYGCMLIALLWQWLLPWRRWRVYYRNTNKKNMNYYHKRRLATILLFILSLSVATGLILFSLKKNLNAFLTPSQITQQQSDSNHHFRLGGLVKTDSLKRHDNLAVEFIVTDLKQELPVEYNGVLPDLFREGKGMVAEGQLKNGRFIATQILAKHDENYMPQNVAAVIKSNA